MWITEFLMKYRRPLFENEGKGGGSGGEGEGEGSGNDGKAEGDEKGAKSGLGGGLLDRRKKDGDEGQGDGEGEGEGEEGSDATDDGRPEGLAEKFWDAKTKKINTEALIKSQVDLEKAYGKLKREKSIGGEVPESADEYFADGLDLGEEVDRLTVDGPDDPGLKAWGKVCHKYGIGKELAVNLAKDMFGMMNEHAPEPIDPDAEYEALGKGADAIIDGVFVWVEGAEKSGRLSEDDVEIVNSLQKTAKGIKFLSAMRSLAGEERIPIVTNSGKRGMSADTWHEEMKKAVKEKDYKRQEELDAMSADIIGDHEATGGRSGGVNSEKVLTRR